MTRWAGLLGASNMAVAGLGVIQAVVVARWLGPEQYGLAALVVAYPSVWAGLFDAKAKQAAVRYLSEFHAKGERDHALAVCKLSYATDIALAALSCGFVLATLPFATALVPGADVAWLVALYSFGLIPHALTGTSRAALSVLGRFDLLAGADVVLSVGRVALVIGLTLLGKDVAGLVIGMTAGFAMTGLVYGLLGYVVMRRSWGGTWISARLSLVRDRWKEVAGFLVRNSADVTLGTILGHVDVLLLGWVRSTSEVGGYKLAKNVAGMLAHVRVPLETVVYVELARSWGAGEYQRFREGLTRFGLGIGVPVGALCITSIVAIPFVLPYFVGPAYGPAVGVAQVLLVSAAWQTAFFWLRIGYMASDRFGSFVVGSGLCSAVLLLIWILVVDQYGQWGLALATLVVGVVQSVVLTIVLFRGLLDTVRSEPVDGQACRPRV